MDRTSFFPKNQVLIKNLPPKEKVWVFLLAGQSNMAGRGQVEPKDTVTNQRIFTINKEGQILLAKEPLHFYEPNLAGLDCGLSFGQELLKNAPKDVSILIIPTAVGGSSISQWINDETHRDVALLSNFREKMNIGKSLGIIKAILWHQGENDANPTDITLYSNRLHTLFTIFRQEAEDSTLPVFIAELGAYSEKNTWLQINNAIHHYAQTDQRTSVISTKDLNHKGDKIHFDSKGQREIGKRFANAYILWQKKITK